MSVVSMKQLLESGVHFGHQTKRWNPKMREYIYTQRNGIHIIDLQKSSFMLDNAYKYVKELSEDNKDILFVGTKKQAKDSIREEAARANMPFVDSRWLGGTLTNLKTIRSRVSRLDQLEKMKQDGTLDLMTKKEASEIELEIEKLTKKIGGIRKMKTLPSAIFVIDPKKERNAVLEARKLNIPVVAVCDTNCDPDEVDCIIPGNDDAVRAVKLFCHTIANAIIEGHEGEIPIENSENSFTPDDFASKIEREVPNSDFNNENNNGGVSC